MLILLVLLFFGPMALSMFLYFTSDAWRPDGLTAHGVLLSDPVTLAEVPWTTSDGREYELTGKWLLIHVVDGDCDQPCSEALVHSRQVRRALGREMSRVQRVLWLGGSHPAPDTLPLEHAGLLVLDPPAEEAVRIRTAAGAEADGSILLADPLGNLIMRFPAGTPMKDLHEDLKHLLRTSRIG